MTHASETLRQSWLFLIASRPNSVVREGLQGVHMRMHTPIKVFASQSLAARTGIALQIGSPGTHTTYAHTLQYVPMDTPWVDSKS